MIRKEQVIVCVRLMWCMEQKMKSVRVRSSSNQEEMQLFELMALFSTTVNFVSETIKMYIQIFCRNSL